MKMTLLALTEAGVITVLSGLGLWTVSNAFVSGYIICCLVGLCARDLFNCPQRSHLPSNYRHVTYGGLWCCLLLPVSQLVVRTTQAQTGVDMSWKASPGDVVLLSTVSLTLETSFRSCRSHGRVGTLLYFYSLAQLVWLVPDVTGSGFKVWVLALGVLYVWLLVYLPRCLPASFSEGETAVIAQLLVAGISQVVLNLDLSLQAMQSIPAPRMIAAVIFLTVSMATAVLPWLSLEKYPVRLYGLYGVMGLCLALPVIVVSLQQNPVIWILHYICLDCTRIALFVWWLLCAVVSGGIVYAHSVSSEGDAPHTQVSTVERKYFHMVMLAVYVPGLLWDAQFLYLASVGAMAVLVLLETVRLYRVPPFGHIVDEAFEVFRDKQDSGCVLLTPLYLLMGCSMPLWLSYGVHTDNTTGSQLPMYAGVIALGVGDTMASIGGTIYGRHKWPGSQKTIEGTVTAIAAQILLLPLLQIFGVTGARISILTTSAVVLTSVLEAATSQIDNLVLPLAAYCLLSIR